MIRCQLHSQFKAKIKLYNFFASEKWFEENSESQHRVKAYEL